TVHRFERADAKESRRIGAPGWAPRAVTIVEAAEQIDQADRRDQVASVRSEMHARQRDFFETGGDDAIDLRLDGLDTEAARAAARGWDDAVGARFGAAGLDAQRERSAAGDPRSNARAAAPIAIAKPLGRRHCRGRDWSALGLGLSKVRPWEARPRESEPNYARLLVVRHDARDVCQFRNFVGAACRITAGDDDACPLIVAGDP